MIKGKIKTNLTINMIRERIDDYNIFCYYLGETIDFKKKYSSPFRENGVDNTPNLSFWKAPNGNLIFKDFANGYGGDCFRFIMLKYNITLQECLKKIDKDFNLGLYYELDPNLSPNFKMKLIKAPEINSERNIIQVLIRPFTGIELDYWKDYSINGEELNNSNVYGISALYVNKQLIIQNRHDLRFAYKYDNFWKIYTPLSGTSKFKWISNVPNNFMSGFDDIKAKVFYGKQSEKLIITKSKKDEIILKKFFNDVCSTQNESIGSISHENLKVIQEGYNPENVYMAYDRDEVGKRVSRYYEDNYRFKSIYVSNYYGPNIKDWGEFIKNSGWRVVENYLQGLKLI